MFSFLKKILGSTRKNQFQTPTEYPGKMAEIVGNLVFVQLLGTGLAQPGPSTLQAMTTLSEDPYCLGYLMGMFDCPSQNWNVPEAETPMVLYAAFSLAFNGMVEDDDVQLSTAFGVSAFNRAIKLAHDQKFSRGQMDGGSELKKYGDTKDRSDMPKKLNAYLLSKFSDGSPALKDNVHYRTQ